MSDPTSGRTPDIPYERELDKTFDGERIFQEIEGRGGAEQLARAVCIRWGESEEKSKLLDLIDILVTNCDDPFHISLAEAEFFQTIVSDSKVRSDDALKSKVSNYLEKWIGEMSAKPCGIARHALKSLVFSGPADGFPQSHDPNNTRSQESRTGVMLGGSDPAPDGPEGMRSSLEVGNTGVIQWVRGKLIGEEAYSKVYLAFNATSGAVFAVKRAEMPESASYDPKRKLVLEAIEARNKILQDLDHLNIIQYLGFEQTAQYLSIFLEYVSGGSIGELLRKLERGFNHDLIKYYTGQIVDGLAYLHSRGVLHRNLNPNNILVSLEGVCKISGFGLLNTDTYANNNAATDMQGSIFWMAPEVVYSPNSYHDKADIWSMACIVLEMWSGLRPWHGFPAVQVILMLGSPDTRQPPPLPSNLEIPPDGIDFMRRCFALEPKERPTAEKLKGHPYLTNAG